MIDLNNPKDVERFSKAIELGAKIDEANKRRIRRSIYLQKEAFCHMKYECEICLGKRMYHNREILCGLP